MGKPTTKLLFSNDRIVFYINDEDDEINVVYLTKLEDGKISITVESDANHQHGKAVTQILNNEQRNNLVMWLDEWLSPADIQT